jgi:hypothetical protein
MSIHHPERHTQNRGYQIIPTSTHSQSKKHDETELSVIGVKTSEPHQTPDSGRHHSRRLHWRMPCVMVSSLFVGITLAIGHHFFYRYWNGKMVNNDYSQGWLYQDWTSQNWIIRYGTAFAFLVKVFCAISTSSAYIQQQWSTLHSKMISIDGVDTIFGILTDFTLFVNVLTWTSNPLLALTAIITWFVAMLRTASPF